MIASYRACRDRPEHEDSRERCLESRSAAADRAELDGEVNYVGSHTVHVLREVDGAPLQPALVQALLQRRVCQPAPCRTLRCTRGGQYTDAAGNTVPFDPAVNNTAFYHILFQTSAVNGNYNALQAGLTEQVGGLSLTGSYTVRAFAGQRQRSLVPGAGDSGLPTQSVRSGNEYGNSDYGRAAAFCGGGHLCIADRAWPAVSLQRLLGRVLDGIQISGIQQVQTGLPFDLRGTVDNLHPECSTGHSWSASPIRRIAARSLLPELSTGPAVTAFANAPFGEDVSIRRNKFHGPGFVNTDAVFQKTQQLHENLRLVFRVEGYNVFNHPNFDSPSSLNISDPTFGQSTSQVGQNDGTTGARQLQGAIKVIF